MKDGDPFKLALIWIAGAVVCLAVGLAPLSAAYIDGHYIPGGTDAFYHARRILDAVANPSGFYQFDSHMDAPEGSLITWPWSYDWLLSLVARAGLALHLTKDPMVILDHLPVLGFIGAMTLMMVICRQLQLSLPATALAVLATVLFPLNQSTFQIGNFHHHFAEQLFVLGSLAAGLYWLRNPERRVAAALAGVVLGTAVGVHTAQFILQLPMDAALVILWLRRMPLPRTLPFFAASLLAATLLVALPSLPLQRGHFDTQTLSWFQVYFSLCSSVLCLLIRWRPFSQRNLIVLLALVGVMALPAASQILFAGRFLSNAVAGMDIISEVRSPWHMLGEPGGITRVDRYYSLLIWLSPLVIVVSVWSLWRTRAQDATLWWVSCLFGMALLMQQLRMNYFGSYALYLPWLLLIDGWVRTRPDQALVAFGLTTMAGFLALAPGITGLLFTRRALANDVYYQVTQRLYPTLAAECRKSPGVVLAAPFDGHYIRYHSDCDVIANPFLVTDLNERKYNQELALLKLPAAQVASAAPEVRYVFVRRANLFYTRADGSTLTMPAGNPADPDLPLVQELLAAPAEHLPPHFRLIRELYFARDDGNPPYARLFAVDRP